MLTITPGACAMESISWTALGKKIPRVDTLGKKERATETVTL